MNIVVWKRPLFLLLLILIGGVLTVASEANAEESTCGDIVAPGYFFNPTTDTQTIERQSISDCADPFTEDEIPPSPYTLKVDGNDVLSGGTVTVAVGGTRDIFIDGWVPFTETSEYLFKHEGGDYVYIDRRIPEITDEQYIEYAPVYFANFPDKELYEEIITAHYETGFTGDYFYDEEGEYILDAQGVPIYDNFMAFFDAAEAALTVPPPVVRAGTYTMVIKEYVIALVSKRTWGQVLKDLFIPTVYAQEYIPPLTYTITFTIIEGEQVSVPSILFLPGIMGSRLYEESEECNLFGGADKVERWFSAYDCDVERLLMDESGQSTNILFTEEGGVIDEVAGQNLYKSFMADLATWKGSGQIADYRTVPYDWRLRLEDILKSKNIAEKITFDGSGTYQDGYLYKSLVDLKNASPSGKVVLVGHSNGGLVIKALLATMKAANDPLLPAIEKVILVAVPQVGTPESVAGMLHGVKMGKGFVLSQEESRKLMNTAPFAYNLLPTSEYYHLVETPVINFEPGASTDAWIAQFGSELDTAEEVKLFMTKESGRDTPSWSSTHLPTTIYSNLLEEAVNTHSFLNTWRPSSVNVYEVGGIGIDTPASVTYFTDMDCVRIEQEASGHGRCIFEPKLGYRVNEVIDGDGTVITGSAHATQSGDGVEKWWVDLMLYNKSSIDRIHRDIFEVNDVRKLVSNIVFNTIGSYTFLSKTEPNFDDEERIVYRLHSPLDLYVILNDGEVVGSSTPLLRGVQYSRYGEVQSLSIPKDEEGYEIRLSGLASGSFTLETESYTGNTLENRTTYSAIPSSTSTEVVLMMGDTLLQIDYEGDGVFEAVAEPGLAVINSIESEVTEGTNRTSGTRVKNRSLPLSPIGELSSVTVTSSEQELLLHLIRLLTQYRDLLIKLRVQ